uniref:probable receptor-like protein kinase At2g23200 n=1 Tax=Erigeron canadensis TaxID=72917 RepID=UPI001CB8DD00|nr:probable receptor-like protein kinase At2g23200 [Erigeron canadensis]
MSSFSVRYRSEIGDAIRRSCLNDLNIPFEEILSATDNFAAENLIELGSSKFCRGKLLQSEKIIDILVGEIHEEDMMMLFLLQHENISTILYCTTNNDYRNILFIKKIEVNGSLAENLSAGSTLSWTQRLSICIGVAKALKYIHSSDFLVPGYHVIHGNIKSSEILLDDNWQPKLQGFESAIVAERNTVHVTSTYKGTLQYMDPTYEKTGALTDKSDVFSFGVVLFEVLFGRETTATPTEAQQDDWNFAEFARLHWKNKTLKKMIDPNMWNNMDSKSVEIFSNVAYACLTEQREKRPNMDQVVRELEESFRLQKNHENSSMVSKTSCSHLQVINYSYFD